MIAAIGAGANLGRPRETLRRAVEALREVGRVAAVSPVYRTAPWGVVDQPEFYNLVALVDTQLDPQALLRELQTIERRLGRVPSVRWGPRAIDLDILTYGDRPYRGPGLEIPHPRLAERAFALVPLADVDARYASAAAALPEAERQSVQRIPPGMPRSRGVVDWEATLERVRSAAEFCAESGLERFRIDEDEFSVEVRRSRRPVRQPAAAPAEAHAGNGVAASSNGTSAAPAAKGTIVKAEFVGIVRLTRPAVVPGAVLAEDRELAYVEALGIRNPVRAGGPGRIAEVFVDDGQSVEYGQPLFSVET